MLSLHYDNVSGDEMKKKILFLILPAFIYADGLQSLLEFATSNNKIVASNVLTQKAKKVK